MNPVRRRLGIVTLVIVALLAQTAFLPHLRLFGIVPDAVIVAVVAVAAREGPEVGALAGFGAGATIDLFLEVPLGLSALAYVLVGYGMGVVRSDFLRERWWLAPLLAGSGSLAAGLIFVLAGVILGEDHLLTLRTFTVIPVRALYDAGLSLVVFPLASRLMGPLEDAVASYRM